MIFESDADGALDLLKADAEKAKRAIFHETPKLNLVDWAEAYRVLPSTSQIGGPWRTSHFEVARGPMLAATEPGVKMITAMVAVQTLKTELLLNLIGYYSHLKPCPILIVEPKQDAIRNFSKERLTPMALQSPALRDILLSDRVRGGKDTLFYKEFPGGFLAMAYAGSATELAMRAIRIVLLDEIDKYERIKNEGDPVFMAEGRAATFEGNSLKVRVCSPTWAETSRIYKSYLESDQRRPAMKCPHCDHWQFVEFFSHVHWAKDEDGTHHPETAAIVCEQCKQPWSEDYRKISCTTEGGIRWYQTAKFWHCGEWHEPMKLARPEYSKKLGVGYARCPRCGERGIKHGHAGFTASHLFRPQGNVVDLARDWLLMKALPEQEQVFRNERLGQPFESRASKPIHNEMLMARRENFDCAVPKGVLAITAGIDQQDYRAEIEIVGWGLGYESWSLGYHVIPGDPSQKDFCLALDKLLQKVMKDHLGRPRMIDAACYDSGGHHTDQVYRFCAARVARRVYAIKGKNEKNGNWGTVWQGISVESKRSKEKAIRPHMIGVNAAKETIRRFLQIDTAGPGYCHFPVERTENYFEQLTSENLQMFPVRKWVQISGRANEALDCRVYAYAALDSMFHIYPYFNFETRAARLAALGQQRPIESGKVAVPTNVHRSKFMS